MTDDTLHLLWDLNHGQEKYRIDLFFYYHINDREGVKYIIYPEKIVSGGPPQDGIQSMDRPKFGSIEDAVNGTRIRVDRDDAGIVRITNLETGEEIIKERDFWFAWYAFHPETEPYSK